MTIFYRNLSNVTKEIHFNNLDFVNNVQEALYKPNEITADLVSKWNTWLDKYKDRLQNESASDQERRIAMDKVNPKYVLRNYMAQLAIDAADNNDYSIIEELYSILQKPYDEQPHAHKWFAKRPEWARTKVGCSMLSCSS